MNNAPPEVEKYFNVGRRKIQSVTVDSEYALILKFDNDETRIYDMKELLRGAFEPLKDKSKFNKAFIDENGSICWDIDPLVDSSIVWNNRLDLCADSCYIYSIPIKEDKYAKSI